MKQIAAPLSLVVLLSAFAACSPRAHAPSAEGEVASFRGLLDQRDQELTDMSRGMGLLVTLSDSQQHRSLFDFLKGIESTELRCTVRNLTDYPLLLYSFHNAYVLPDGSHRPVYERKSALVVTDATTRSAIDYVVGNGYRTEGHVSGKHWTTEWQHQDGTRVQYRILTSGFEKIDN